MMKKEKLFWIILGLSLLWFVFYLYLTLMISRRMRLIIGPGQRGSP
jgi:type IV secretory pathway VirB6-like protein